MTSTNTLTPTCELEPSPREQVILWIIDGNRDADIQQAIKEKWPTLDPKELQTQAVDHFLNASRCDPAVIHGWAFEAYRDLYRRMIKIGDFSNAMKAVSELVKLTKYVQHVKESEPENDERKNGS